MRYPEVEVRLLCIDPGSRVVPLVPVTHMSRHTMLHDPNAYRYW